MSKINKVELYNSLTKKKEEFKSIDDGTVRMYSCGPTVYDSPHIGNLSTFIRDDLLKRTLRAAGYKVKHVMNITDVDDKTIRDSKNEEYFVEGDEMQSLLNLTDKFSKVFREDIEKVGNDVDSVEFIRATETVKEMVELTNDLLRNGIAYRTEDGMYFSISRYLATGKEYGLLQKLNLSQSRSRIDNDEYEKDSAADFALWKARGEGEPVWGAEFEDSSGKFSMAGRPGWHIECSAMSQKLLGVPFDIHTGGIDLKFPHHENEIAQSCGALGTEEFAKTFVHMSHILVDGRKMAKSAKNFYTLRDIEERGFDPMAFRVLVLSGHYRSEINFSWEILEAAQNRLKNWRAIADLTWQGEGMPEDSSIRAGLIETFIYNMEEYLFDDLYTPKLLALIDSTLNDAINVSPSLGFKYKQGLTTIIMYIENYLGVRIMRGDISAENKELLQKRQKARDEKDFAESDRIRDELRMQGIEVRDDKNGQIWSRV
jgi:cysteinyl-tRNA synthetase